MEEGGCPAWGQEINEKRKHEEQTLQPSGENMHGRQQSWVSALVADAVFHQVDL